MMRLYKNRVWRYVHIFLGIAAVLAAFYLATKVSSAYTYNYSWAKSYVTVSSKDSNEIPPAKKCIDKDLIISGVHDDYRTYCYYDYGSWGYTNTDIGHMRVYNIATYGSDVAAQLEGVRLGDWYDNVDLYDLPGTDNLLVINDGQNALDQPSTRIVSDVDSRLKVVDLGYSYTPRYVMTLDTENPVFSIEHTYGGETPTAKSVAISENGDWLVLALGSMHQWSSDAYGFGLVRVNLRTYETKRFASLDASYVNDTTLAITNDGESVAIALGQDMTFYDVEDDCGDSLIVQTNERPINNECPSTYRRSIISKQSKISELNFLDDKTLLLMDSNSGKRAELSIGGGGASDHLEYLAMGDSYSSGEGDIGGGNHYLKGTDGKDLCHVSNRSYPFLLRDYYGISRENMESVACSGAQVTFDYIGDDINYGGQGKRLANKGFSRNKIKSSQLNALSVFRPGETKQINFIKEYKPYVITFTGGGNDIGFTRVLKECARLGSIGTCGYAKDGSYLHQMLYDGIDSQYKINKIFIDKIQEVSPDTRIVMIGYPSFIAGSDSKCNLSKFEAGLLNGKERDMINDAVERLNVSFRNLATSEGISYVDLEKTLYGGRVCEDGGYVNSVDDVGINRVVEQDDPAVFHPNHKGHEKMKQAIVSEGVMLEPKLVDGAGSWTEPSPKTLTLPQYFIDRARVLFGDVMKITTSPGVFWQSSLATGLLHSDPINLGTFETNDDGSLTVDIPTEDLPPGPHVLIFEGIGPDGEPVRYYQHIFIDYPDDKTPEVGGVAKKTNEKSGKEVKSAPRSDKSEISNIDQDYDTGTSSTTTDSSVSNDNTRKLDNKSSKDYKKEAVSNMLKRSFSPVLLLPTCIIVIIIGIIYAKHRHRTNN